MGDKLRSSGLYIYKNDSMLQVSVIEPCDEQDRRDTVRSGDMQVIHSKVE